MIKNISNQVIPLYIQSEGYNQYNLNRGEVYHTLDISSILNITHLLDPAMGLLEIREGVN